MRLYEIKAGLFERSLAIAECKERTLMEVGTADIEDDLEKTANNIGKASAVGRGDDTSASQGAGDNMGAGDFAAAPDPAAGQSQLQQQGEEPDLAADDPLGSGATDDEKDELLMKKVDSILVSAAKGHSYAKNYRHEDNSRIHPYAILSMTMDELNSLRTMARNKASQETFGGEVGTYDNPDIRFFQDLVSYIDKVIEVKKSSTKDYNDKKQGKTAKFDKQADSKTKPGDQPKAKQEK